MALDRLGAQSGRAEHGQEHELVALLRRQGISCALISSDEDLAALVSRDGDGPALALVDTGYMTTIEVGRCLQACADADVRAIALTPRRRMPHLDPSLPMADFIVSPPDPDELVIRAQRALTAGASDAGVDSHIIREGELQIDTSSYEVTVKRRARGAAVQGVRAAEAAGGESWQGVFARCAAEPDMGLRVLRGHAHGGRAHTATEEQDRGRGAPFHRDYLERGVQVQGVALTSQALDRKPGS